MQMFECGRRYWLALSLALFALAVASPAWASETVYAQTDVVMHQSPADASSEVTRLPAGAAVLSQGVRGNWLNVKVDVDGESVNGWIRKGDVGANPPG